MSQNTITLDGDTLQNIAQAAATNAQLTALLAGYHRALKLDGEWKLVIDAAHLEGPPLVPVAVPVPLPVPAVPEATDASAPPPDGSTDG